MNPLMLCDNEDQATNFAIDWLRSKGFTVTQSESMEMMTPAELRERFAPHLTSNGICMRLKHEGCPWFHARRGPRGRIITLLPTPELIAWISAPRSPGRWLERRAA